MDLFNIRFILQTIDAVNYFIMVDVNALIGGGVGIGPNSNIYIYSFPNILRTGRFKWWTMIKWYKISF